VALAAPQAPSQQMSNANSGTAPSTAKPGNIHSATKSKTLWHCIFHSLLHPLKVPLPTCWFSRSCLCCRKCHSVVGWLRLWLCVPWNNVKACGHSWQQHNKSFPFPNRISWILWGPLKQSTLGIDASLLCHCWRCISRPWGLHWHLCKWLRHKGLEVVPALG
jgi:hypothetical protein